MTEGQWELIRRIVAVLAAVAFAGFLVLAFLDDATSRPVAPNGDMLGTEAGESFEDYSARAAESLAAATDPAYALITFAEPLTPAEAAEVLEPLDRVNALVVALAPPFALPEPVDGETRADVFDRELGRIGDSLTGIGNVPVPERVDAVVAHDTGDTLRVVATDDAVDTIEVLPPDAAWGRFGVRPVQVPNVP